MPTYTQPTEINWSEGFSGILYYVNDVTNSWVSILLLVAIYIITSISVYSYKKTPEAFFDSIAIAGFLTIVVGILFWTAEFISGTILAFVIGVGILSFASLWMKPRL